MAEPPLIEIRDLSIGFRSRGGATLEVLRNIDLQVGRGETVGLVGESGSGKSTLALAATGYLKRGLRVLGGTVTFGGDEMFSLSTEELERIRGGVMALIPQNSGQSLTPSTRVGRQLSEALMLHGRRPRDEHPDRIIELLTQVRLPEPEAIVTRYPHELSGGQQQRVAVAMALAGEPEALQLDEPTTGLDVTTQAHILELLRELGEATGMAMVYVSHDLGAIARVCHRVMVMYAGEVVQEGDIRQVFRNPAHPYARGLLASIPKLREARLPAALDGVPPPPSESRTSCAFADRCVLAVDRCRTDRPNLNPVPTGERVRCHLIEEAACLPMDSRESSGYAPAGEAADGHAGEPVLELSALSISYARPGLVDQLLGRRPDVAPTVEGVSLRVARGQTIGLVGESGSGKSTVLKSVAGRLPPVDGEVRFAGTDVLPAEVDRRSPDELRRIQLVFQNPDESLNPRHTVAEILAQPLRFCLGLTGEELVAGSHELLDRVRLGAHYMTRLPGQLSGGEKQRVAIARAFAAGPDVVLCDEVTSALDVSVQAAVLDLLNHLKQEQGTTYVFVSNDLAVVRALSDMVAVLYQGRQCEVGPSVQVCSLPSHPYTEVLLGAVLEPDPDTAPVLIADDVVELSPPAEGCPFQRRCPRRVGVLCDTETPPWRKTREGQSIRCHIPLADLHRSQREGAATPARTPLQ